MLYKIAKLIATVFYIGKIPIAPGTFGSLASFPICYIIMYFTLKYQVVFGITSLDQSQLQFVSLLLIEIIATLILFIIGIYFSAIYIKNSDKKDPKEVVIDEVVGQMLVIIFCSFSEALVQSSKLSYQIPARYIDILFLFLFPFVLFRLFDILKPWPINWCDKNITGAFGIMFDDIVAGIFASVVQYVVVFVILDFYK